MSIKFEVYNRETEKILYLKNNSNQNIGRISPKYINWSFKNTDYLIYSEMVAKALFIGEEYILIQHRGKTFRPNIDYINLYDFYCNIKYKIEPPILKTKELNPDNKNFKSSFSGFNRLERKNENSPYEISIDDQDYVLVCLYDDIHCSHSPELDDRGGKLHELQALNIRTGKFHDSWCKFYGRL
ncbi:hypothetical protein [Leeuwenhoekiella sp. MAR_2009_132]|uniref:hypothetical protein n=1 Tax=Leeuwenhoekiella sp. MAR_2009_132 TaxID=1392489 RepID=UPI00048B7713|nr:hypothetical protein [Leeuwenhoekiella sp. MAR_2009_132]